ncbi:ABC transporter substrate-binding protein [Alienimonas sp. DA493]|uniref:ABC transporter substrate-binding protein n=1 Tax=Alienimonas sp. DA493 TaxID=3373605 RepID=UPI003754D90A
MNDPLFPPAIRLGRALAACALLVLCGVAPARAQNGLPTLEDLPLPSAAELLARRPTDRLVLRTGGVIEVAAVSPRPDTLAKLARRHDYVQRMAGRDAEARKAEIARYLRGDPAEPKVSLRPQAVRRLAEEFDALPDETIRRAVEELGGREAAEKVADLEGARLRAEAVVGSRDEYLATAERLERLDVFLLDEELEDPEFSVDTFKVDRIIHHEDLMLERADALLAEGDMRTAYELLFALARMRSSEVLPDGWPGLRERLDRAAFIDAGELLELGQLEGALGRMEVLLDRAPEFPGGLDRLAAAADGLIETAVAADDQRKARFFLARLRSRGPQHPVTRKWDDQFSQRALALMADANAAAGDDPARAADLIREAARVDPTAPGVERAFTRLTRRYQVLRAGVLDLPPPDSREDSALGDAPPPFPPTDAADRGRFLVASRLFEIDRVDEAPHYRSNLLEGWEPTDLGRRATFSLRPGFPGWLPQPPLDAADVLAGLQDRLDQNSPLFEERLAEEIAGVRQLSPREFEVIFNRVPLRTEATLAAPVRVLPREPGAADGSPAPVLKTPFFPREPDSADRPGVAVYRRAVPEPADSPQFHVAEVRETAYPDGPSLMQAFRRGEFDLLVHPRPWDVPALLRDESVLSFRSSVPAAHVLQVNPRSETMKNAELRKALLLAPDREAIMNAAVFRTAEAQAAGLGRVISAPFPSFSEATNPLLEPRRQNLTLAFALALAAGKALGADDGGQVPELTILAPDDAVVAGVLDELAATWERIGLTIRVVSGSDAARLAADDPDGWDLAYRTLRMREPAREIAPLLTNSDDVTLESLLTLSDWLRRDLIALERVGNRNDAVALLHDLHRHMRSEVRVIPLFEIDEYVFARTTLRNVEGPLVHPYQGVERWQVDATPPADDFELPEVGQ